MRWGANLDHNVDGVIEVVKPATYRKWLRLKKRKVEFKKSGRPRIAECVTMVLLSGSMGFIF
jgi:putative transposase